MVLWAASSTLAVSSMILVALPAPTPSAGRPELQAARTMGWPPVAKMRSERAMSACDIGIFTFCRQWRMSGGAPSRSRASRMSRTVSKEVFRARGWGEKMTTSPAGGARR